MSLAGAAEAPLVQSQVPVTAESRPPAATTPRLLYVVSEDWYFLSHRLPMARAASNDGFEVHVATHVQDGGAAMKARKASYCILFHTLAVACRPTHRSRQ